jgi:serine/threonine protein kinase
MDRDMIGGVIQDRYKLIDERGRGSFATVYIARTLEDYRIYAVKVMHREFADDAEMLARFQREAQILLNFNDVHIVRIFDYGNDDDMYYIVMDYIDGQSLKYHMMRQRQFEPLRALRYAQQIAEGLEVASNHGVVHRDIKPQNILVSSRDLVKITDFGLARVRDAITLTGTDVFMGTAYYISPEQADSGRLADTRSDLYSVAVVLFEMLAGKPPYEGEHAADIVSKHMSAKIPSVCRLNPDLPIEVDRFMQQALAKSPADRFATPREFIAALERLQERFQTVSLKSVARSTIGPKSVPTRVANLVLLSNGYSFALKGEKMLVGRQDPKQNIYPEIVLADQKVGREHAYLRSRQGTYTVEDLASRNNTRLNGVVLTPHEEYPLKDGDILRFGSVEARFELR